MSCESGLVPISTIRIWRMIPGSISAPKASKKAEHSLSLIISAASLPLLTTSYIKAQKKDYLNLEYKVVHSRLQLLLMCARKPYVSRSASEFPHPQTY